MSSRPATSREPATTNGFAVTADGERWNCGGTLAFSSARAALETTSKLPLPALIDCSGIDNLDSTAIALLLAWKRRATAERKTLAFVQAPTALLDLAKLYGVAEILFPS